MNPEPIYVGLAVWGGVWTYGGMVHKNHQFTTRLASTLALCIGLAGVML